jgi:septal ring factor EnvC (AmiA/AmiB activator)
MRRAVPLAVLIGLALAGPAASAADQASAAAEATAERLRDARVALAEAGPEPGRIAALAGAIAAQEAALSRLRAAVNTTSDAAFFAARDIALREAEVKRLLAALQALGRVPPPAQNLHPMGPLGAARAEGMMAAIRPALAEEARALSWEVATVARKRAARDAAEAELAAGLEALAAARADLAGALAETAGIAVADSGDPRLNALMRESDTLTRFAAGIEGLRAQASSRSADAGRETFALPVPGTVLRGFDEPDAAGVRRPGMTLAAPPLSLVTAPAPAEVRYAGPFLDYGYVVFLEPEPETLIVIAGMQQLFVVTGARVEAGAPLGMLGGRDLDVEEYLMLPSDGNSTIGSETLYIELRRERRPVDPAPWFAALNG